MRYRTWGGSASWGVAVVALMSAVAASLAVVMLAPARPDPHVAAQKVAAQLVGMAERCKDPGGCRDSDDFRDTVAEAIRAALPPDARAVVGLPSAWPGTNAPPPDNVAGPGNGTSSAGSGQKNDSSARDREKKGTLPTPATMQSSSPAGWAGEYPQVTIVSANEPVSASVGPLKGGEMLGLADVSAGAWIVVVSSAPVWPRSAALGAGLAALLGAAITGLLLLLLLPQGPTQVSVPPALGQALPSGAAAYQPDGAAACQPAPSPSDSTARVLVQGVADLVPDLPEAISWQVSRVLRDAGIDEITPDGAPFDPASHHVVGLLAAPEPGLVDTVARTVRPGYALHGKTLVPPRVALFADHPDAAEPT